ncbi:MAG: hypothetical protein KDA58_10445, partial [Planctomycetaceae bacterium]|nr:hypothetical protein [Planctomycetaceae bacterium]
MSRHKKRITQLAILAVAITSIVPPQLAWSGWPFGETTVVRLAKSIDRLEKHLDQYGTVVAKDPDVWGEARLTKYRQDYEEQMKGQLTEFKSTINGAISRSDQAFLSSAFALQAAISGRGAQRRVPTRSVGPDGTTTITQTYTDLAIPGPTDATELKSNPLAQTQPSAKQEILGFAHPDGTDVKGVALEPTVFLDQMSRYLNHLNQLRRVSDGDDKSDAPGYGLHLVRLPISVLPGKKTREGYGAEVTVIAKPHLHDQLLQETFRGLVINDLVDQWSFPLAKFLDDPKAAEILERPVLCEPELSILTTAVETATNNVRDLQTFL